VRINHRIAAENGNPFWREIGFLALEYEHGDISVLNVTEDHPQWPEVERLLAQYKPVHFIHNIFSREEMDAADWFVLSAKGHHGYPMPEDNFGYLEATYDVAYLCPICGIGGVQKAPFRLRAEPKAARSQFLQLNWVFDEFFLRKAAADCLAIAGITGIEYLVADWADCFCAAPVRSSR
jgi:hypothetical protein